MQSRECHTQLTETVVHLVRSDSDETNMLTEFFVSKGIGVVTFRTASDYVAARRDERPTCLILDLILPDADGLEVQSRLADTGAPPVIFVTSSRDPIPVVRAMKNGAIDLMLEPVDFSQLMTAVELAFAEDLKCRNERMERTSLLARWQTLTPRETEVFHHTVAGLLNKQAAAELGVAENTYQVHRGRVMRKMKANSLADLVRMSTKLEPILPKPYQRRLATRQQLWALEGSTSTIPTRDREYQVRETARNERVAMRAY